MRLKSRKELRRKASAYRKEEERGEAPNGGFPVCGASASAKFTVLLIGGFPRQNSHRYIVCPLKIALQLLLQIVKRIETQVVVKAFLIVSVAAFNLAVMPRRSRSENMMPYMVIVAEQIKRVNAFCFGGVSKFTPTVCLDLGRSITEPSNCSLDKIDRGAT